MSFKPPCEILLQVVIPAIRAEIVRKLVTDHGLKQTEIAEKLGITQPSVSQYVSGTRGHCPDFIKENPEVQEYIDEVAEKIASGEMEGEDISMCEPCRILRMVLEDEKLPSRCYASELTNK